LVRLPTPLSNLLIKRWMVLVAVVRDIAQLQVEMVD
jgi:hypothetical protein